MEILYLNSKDIEEINLTNDEIINAVEDSLKAQGKEKPPLSRGFISIQIRNTTDILMCCEAILSLSMRWESRLWVTMSLTMKKSSF